MGVFHKLLRQQLQRSPARGWCGDRPLSQESFFNACSCGGERGRADGLALRIDEQLERREWFLRLSGHGFS